MEQSPFRKFEFSALPEQPLNLLWKSLLMFDTFNDNPGWPPRNMGTPIVFDNAMTIFFCLDGAFSLQVEETPRTLDPGDVMVMLNGMSVTVQGGSENVSFVMIVVESSFYFPILSSRDLSRFPDRLVKDPIRHLDRHALDECMELYRTLRRQAEKTPSFPLQLSSAKALLETLLLVLLSRFSPERERPKEVPHRPQELYSRFRELLSREYLQARDLDHYASRLCVTPRYLARIVREVSGRSASDLIDEVVVTEAKRLIRSRHYTMISVSELLNFSSPSLFGRWFKARTGLTPKQYQDKHVRDCQKTESTLK